MASRGCGVLGVVLGLVGLVVVVEGVGEGVRVFGWRVCGWRDFVGVRGLR